jgi:hypothetical protein
MFITNEADKNCRLLRLFQYLIEYKYISVCELNEPMCTHYELNFLIREKRLTQKDT